MGFQAIPFEAIEALFRFSYTALEIIGNAVRRIYLGSKSVLFRIPFMLEFLQLVRFILSLAFKYIFLPCFGVLVTFALFWSILSVSGYERAFNEQVQTLLERAELQWINLTTSIVWVQENGWEYANEEWSRFLRHVKIKADQLLADAEESEVSRFIQEKILKRDAFDDCSICMEGKLKHRMVQLSCCGSRGCRRCLTQYLDAEVRINDNIDFLCPFNPYDCNELSQFDIRNIIGDDEELQLGIERAYLQHALRQADIFDCPNTNCNNTVFTSQQLDEDAFMGPSSVVYERNRSGKWVKARTFMFNREGCDLRQFTCEECRNSYCVLCRAQWSFGRLKHDGKKCQSFNSRLRRAISGGREAAMVSMAVPGSKRCPSCKAFIQKNGGCSHMSCRCGHQFCWDCLRTYPCGGCLS